MCDAANPNPYPRKAAQPAACISSTQRCCLWAPILEPCARNVSEPPQLGLSRPIAGCYDADAGGTDEVVAVGLGAAGLGADESGGTNCGRSLLGADTAASSPFGVAEADGRLHGVHRQPLAGPDSAHLR